FQGPLQAGLDDLAAAADPLGLFDLKQGRTSVPDGEEQLRILVQTRSTMAPVHGFLSNGRLPVDSVLRWNTADTDVAAHAATGALTGAETVITQHGTRARTVTRPHLCEVSDRQPS